MARQGSMVAYQGNVDFAFEGGGAGKFLKKALTGEGLPLMRCQGQGDVFLAERAYDVHMLNLNNTGLSISGKNVLAFSSSLDWNIERVKGGSIATGGLFNTTLRGTGWVALTTDGPPVVLNAAEAPTFADTNAVVAWSANLQTQLKTSFKAGALIGRGSGEAVQVSFHGQGFVIVQPSEGIQTRDPVGCRHMALWGSAVRHGSFGGHDGLVYEEGPSTFDDLLAGTSAWTDRTFLVHGERRISFAAFRNAVAAARPMLAALGVGAGDRVMVFGYNSPEWIVALWAAWGSGAVPVLANRWWSPAELDHAVALLRPRLVLTDSDAGGRRTDEPARRPWQRVRHTRATARPAPTPTATRRRWCSSPPAARACRKPLNCRVVR